MKYLISGADGQLGKALQERLKNTENEMCLHDIDTMDITNYKQVEKILSKEKPDVIINCAAYTDVDSCEEDIENAYKINAYGARNLAVLSKIIGAKIIHISTDYVFSGDEKQPRIESDFTNPRTVYGKSKLYSEELVKYFALKYFIVRTAWLYGDGNNFVRTMLKLSQNNDKLRVVGDQFGSPTYAKDLANVIIQLSKTDYYGLYHGTCEGYCSWYEFACRIFEYMDINIEVEKITSEQLYRPAKRPYYSILDNSMLKEKGLNTFRGWEIALKDYIVEDRKWQNSNLRKLL